MTCVDDLYARINAYVLLNGAPPSHVEVRPHEMQAILLECQHQRRYPLAHATKGVERFVLLWGGHEVEIKTVDVDSIFERVVLENV